VETSIIKDKHLKLSQLKIDQVKRILKTKTESEAIQKALDIQDFQAIREIRGFRLQTIP